MKIAYLISDDYLSYIDYFAPFWGEEGRFEWRGTEFVVNPESGSFDGLIAHRSVRNLTRTYSLRCPPTKTALFVLEPPDIVWLPEGYTRQFSAVVSQDRRTKCSFPMQTYSPHGWFVERTLREIQESPPVEKSAKISAVVSAKSDTMGHRKRYKFMQHLKEHFGDRLDWWGRGVNELKGPKYTALKDYQYHIALENGSWPHYWTEKLADCFVADCVPIYWGAPNIEDYFDPQTMLRIDIEDIDGSIKAIETAIQSNFFDRTATLREKCREDMITKYHPYQRMIDTLDQLPDSEATTVTIQPATEFKHSLRRRLERRVVRSIA